MGRLSHKAVIQLADFNVKKNEFNLPIIKIKVISDPGYAYGCVGKTGWVQLVTTSFSDLYNAKNKKQRQNYKQNCMAPLKIWQS